MANSMMDSILAMVTPEMKQALAARLGDSPQAIQGGLGAATAATLGGLAAKAGDSGFLGQVMNLAGAANGQNVLGSLASLASGGPAGGVGDLVNKFLPMVFGGQQSQVTTALSQHSGLSGASVSGLLKLAAPLVLGFLGRAHANGTLTAGSLGSMLQAEAPALKSFLPAGLLGNLGAAAGSTVSAVQGGAAAATAGTSRWLVPLAILGALILVWLLMRSMNGPKEAAQTAASATSQAAGAVGNAASSAWAALGEMVAVKLPDGTSLNAPTLGVESRLVTYLNDGTVVVSDEAWFDFDRLLFDTGKATLQPQSQEQIGNIAAILKAFPEVRVRIGGYTDNTGDAAANLKLSQERADNVMAELAKLGVDPSRMEAKGYGEEHPVADNATEEGRQKNRRISLRVLEK
jgi:outer membrane protein OmpA-like peptidoglycan-associated protein